MPLQMPVCDRDCILPPSPDHTVFVWLLFIVRLVVMAVVIVVGVRSLCMALPGFWLGLRRWIATGVADSEGASGRQIKAKAQELRQRFARTLASLIIYGCLPLAIRGCLRAPFLPEGGRRWHAMEGFMLPVFMGAMVLVVIRPKLPIRLLDRLSVALTCTRLAYVVFVARTPWSGTKFDDIRLLECLAQGTQGIVFGNARLAILLNLLKFTVTTGLQFLGNDVCCSQPLFDSEKIFQKAPWMHEEVTIPFFAYAGCSLLAWLKETAEHSWAGLSLQTEAAQKQEMLAKRLLSGMCDACVYLGPQLDIIRGAEQLGGILGSDAGASGRLVGRKFTQLVVDREVDKVAGFLAGSPGDEAPVDEEGAAREASGEGAQSAASPPVSIRTQLKDAFSVVVSVELFHACLVVAGEQVHILGIREEQDRFGSSVQRIQLAQGGPSDKAEDAGGATVEADVDSSSCSSSDVEHAGKTAPRWGETSEMHAVVNIGEEEFNVTCGTPAFQTILGLPPGEQAVPIQKLLHGGDTELEKFEEWVHSLVCQRSFFETGAESEERQLSFRHPGMKHLQVKLSAQCSMRFQGPGQALLTIRSVSWEKCRHLVVRKPRAPRSSQRKSERPQPSPGGTPRQKKAEDFDERDSKGTRERL